MYRPRVIVEADGSGGSSAAPRASQGGMPIAEMSPVRIGEILVISSNAESLCGGTLEDDS